MEYLLLILVIMGLKRNPPLLEMARDHTKEGASELTSVDFTLAHWG